MGGEDKGGRKGTFLHLSILSYGLFCVRHSILYSLANLIQGLFNFYTFFSPPTHTPSLSISTFVYLMVGVKWKGRRGGHKV